MSKTETVATPTAVRSEPAPAYRPAVPDPAEVKRLKLLALIQDAMIRTERGLARWAGGDTQFEATRFTLGGKMDALRAIQAALEGDTAALRDL
jgi:hypothetical protein